MKLTRCYFFVISQILFFETTKSVQNRIINGTISLPAEHPYTAALIYYNEYHCAGSIISPNYILTAAHCFVDLNVDKTTYLSIQHFEISVGSEEWDKGKRYKIKRTVQHPQYVNEFLYNDIVLANIETKLQFNDHVKWIPLYPHFLKDNKIKVVGKVMGWGYTNDGYFLKAEESKHLRTVVLESIPLMECKKMAQYIRKSNICMWGVQKGTCTGDSGGPLVVKINKVVYQIGLVSYGTDCNNTTPEIYTRISSFYGWISKNVHLPHPLTGYN
ncbi:chymotrypsin-1-like [Onthophagus taurus]|uniref:chymotrypsin-1-like n=1 Tax=Onthophagus taurus TaxID=166361 RepID=UPI000C204446|nr:chymotrypsin-1-like [Onthophagus taurus]XP_022905878.1 chymotrypsin-1-like [Onthophagus taurus]XP_022908730.1 chymotrypsin-1-like [Onthophagus taurus]